MIPRPPPREGSLGFLYLPPFRVQGFSVAGEATSISIPEMDLCFDMGKAPRAHLAPKYAIITHGHDGPRDPEPGRGPEPTEDGTDGFVLGVWGRVCGCWIAHPAMVRDRIHDRSTTYRDSG